MAHQLEVVKILTEGDITTVTLACPDCPTATFAMRRWGLIEADHEKMRDQAQRQHDIDIRYDKR